ncbi:hypothetical protein [Niveispirillum fermenti]|uniref:hypothetical protein n=1 Tax=Niveispirillum fermenti TaxID=1233113 RepID=UPI003A856783
MAPASAPVDWSVTPAVRVDGHVAGRLVLELAAGRPVRLVSAPGIAGLAGAGWWAGLLRLWRTEATGPFLALLDCTDLEGQVLSALRAGVTDIVWQPRPDAADGVAARLLSLATAHGARLHPPPVGVTEPCWRRNRAAPLRQYLSQCLDFAQM